LGSVIASEALHHPAFRGILGEVEQSRILDTIDGLIKTFYPIGKTKGRRKERTVLRGSILMGYKNRMA